MSAIVLDGHLKSALACVRSLGKAGISVTCGGERKTAIALHSKWAGSRFVYTSPKVHQEMFIADVLSEAKKILNESGERPVIYCFSDATAVTLARAYARLKEYLVIVLPPLEAFLKATDKKVTYELAEELSIPTIRTYTKDTLSQVAYPAVVKNRHSIVWEGSGSAVTGSATFVFSHTELQEQFESITREAGEEPLVQELIVGEEFGVEMVCHHGEPLATFVHKRIRSLSPKGGAAVVKETAEESESVSLMRTYATKLVNALSWHGPVMVEFKVDRKSEQVLLMEINGRFWGSLPLAIEAGIDFPKMVYDLGRGQNVAKKPEAFRPRHVRTRHFLGDVKWILRVFFAHDRLRFLLYPSRLKALYDFKIELFISKGDIFAFDDMKPAVMEYIDILIK